MPRCHLFGSAIRFARETTTETTIRMASGPAAPRQARHIPNERSEISKMEALADPCTDPTGIAAPSPCEQTLLYIEDNPSNLRLVQRILESRRTATELLTAHTGELGIAAVRSQAPDAVLLDLDLPDMSGEDVLTQLREELGLAVPVVIVSADALPATVDRLLGAGADGYLTKPFEIQEFVDVVDGLLAAERVQR
jgi:CheY-like chemotaxis protein